MRSAPSLLALATMITLRGALASRALIHAPIAIRSRFERSMTARAPRMRILRRLLLLRLLMP